MIFMQMAHQYFGYIFRMNIMLPKVSNQLRYSICIAEPQSGIADNDITVINDQEWLHFYQYRPCRTVIQFIFGFIKRQECLISPHRKSAF
ncbi:hypothetical protein D3C72_1093770 [compost metagenome]